MPDDKFTLHLSIPELQKISEKAWRDHNSLPEDKPGDVNRSPLQTLKINILNVAQSTDALISMLETMKAE